MLRKQIQTLSARNFRSTFSEGQKYETIKLERNGPLSVLKFNRPKKFNAINQTMYEEIQHALNVENQNDDCSLVVLTGAGRFYSSGNDLSGFAAALGEGMTPAQLADGAFDIMIPFVDAFIEFEKPLVALVNGPAIGIAVSHLGLCDLVLAADTASFVTPFTQLGQSAEACSSYTFPKIMGPAKANEMILFNKKISASEAQAAGLVAEVFPAHEFEKRALARVEEYSKLPKLSLKYSKALVRNQAEIDILKAVNRAEGERLRERWASEDCFEAIVNFMSRSR